MIEMHLAIIGGYFEHFLLPTDAHNVKTFY